MIRQLRFGVGILCLLLCGTLATAHEPAEEMAAAATRLLATLTEDERARCAFALDSPDRTNFHFVPDDGIRPIPGRKGLRLDAMNDATRAHAHALLASGLSHPGYLRATSIMANEYILADIEKNSERRDPGKYYICIFGTPEPQGTWGWRCEGHHLSLNVTIKDGKLYAVTPMFFGTNPGIVQHGPQKNLEILRTLEGLGLKLVGTLDEPQRAKAVVSDDVISEIVTNDHSQVDRATLQPVVGLPAGQLTDEQRLVLIQLVGEYTGTFRDEIVTNTTHADDLANPSAWTFAWFGSSEPGESHYFRIQAKTFVLELANVQNDANHVHVVWRDFDGDFGRDLLGEHYREAHK